MIRSPFTLIPLFTRITLAMSVLMALSNVCEYSEHIGSACCFAESMICADPGPYSPSAGTRIRCSAEVKAYFCTDAAFSAILVVKASTSKEI